MKKEETKSQENETQVSQEHKNILRRKVSKSEKMRLLFDLGIKSNKQLSELTGSHPSFVAGVIIQYKRKK